ncbi:hypothetical protein Tco_0778284, partial [Tanacetum coccineum]
MGLLDFVKSVDPFKAKGGEQTLAEGEIPLLIETANMVVPPSAQTLRLVNHTIMDELKENTGKKKRKVDVSTGPLPVMRAKASGVVILEPNPTTAGKSPAAMKKLITQSVSPKVISSILHVQTEAETVAASFANDIWNSTLENKVGVSSTAPGDESPSSLRNQSDAEFLDRLNVNSAQHVCMIFELRLRYEHEITIREKLDKTFVESSGIIQQRNVEIADLRSRSKRAEGEAAEVGMLRKRVSELEATAAAKANEVAGLSVQNSELLVQVSGLESIRDSLMEKVIQLESKCVNLRGQVEGEAKLRELFTTMQDGAVQQLEECGSD